MDANAKEFLPMFARRKVTKEQINVMTDEQIKEVRIFNFLMHCYLPALMNEAVYV